MLKLFVERNLNQTIGFLGKIGLVEDCSISFDSGEVRAIALQNTKNYIAAYSALLCKESMAHLRSAVFCTCCSSRRNFLRNYSLILDAPRTTPLIKVRGHKSDPFLKFIEAVIEKDKNLSIELLVDVINEMPLFWDAYLLLCELTDSFVFLETDLAPFFYTQLKIQKDIDPPSVISNFMKSNSFDLRSLPYNTDVLDANSKAALNYCYGNQSVALNLFKSIDFYKTLDISFFEFYGMLLYNTNDPSIQTICENINNHFRFLPETFTMVGLLRLSNNNYSEAVNLFTRSLKKCKSADSFCLLAYAYIKQNEYGQAVAAYQEAIKLSPRNFRILYSAAQGYFSMNKMEVSLWYCKKALDIRSDGSIYKLMGRIYTALNNIDVAMQYFENSLLHDEVDSLLYMADAYRKKSDMKKALELYERYVGQGQKNIKVVVKYLVDYFEEHGNEDKSRYYREVMKTIAEKS